jgi:hypothetical protein
VRVFSTTFDPIVHLTPKKRVDIYATGGGYFREETQLTGPGIATGIFGNPYFGYYPGAYTANIVASSFRSTNRDSTAEWESPSAVSGAAGSSPKRAMSTASAAPVITPQRMLAQAQPGLSPPGQLCSD